MRNYFLGLILFLSFFCTQLVAAKIQNKIIIKVGNEIVTSYELKNKIMRSLILSGIEINQDNIDKIKKKSVENLISNKLIKIEIKKYDFEVSQNQIKSYIKSMSPLDESELKNRFKEYNLDYDLFLEEIEYQLKWQKLIYNTYSNKISINNDDIENELKNFQKKNSKIIEYNLSEIEIPFKNKDLLDGLIKEIKELISKDGFEDTAIKLSISPSASNKGMLGWVTSASLSKKMNNILKNLKVNEISKPIKKIDSILFIRLNDIREINNNVTNSENFKEKLVNRKKNELFNLYSRSHISKLRNSSVIEYK